MTQQQINEYFLSIGYTETEPAAGLYQFVDPTGEFTFLTDSEFTYYSYPNYQAVSRDDNFADTAALQTWITFVIEDSQNPPNDPTPDNPAE